MQYQSSKGATDMRKLIEYTVAFIGVGLWMGFNVNTVIGFAALVVIWELGERLLLARA
jgi:hypothetical protein